jgi:hypothetical protein
MNNTQSINRLVSIKEISTFFLGITHGHKSYLILVSSTTRRKLLFEHPLATCNLHVCIIWLVNKLPNQIGKKKIHLTMDNFFSTIRIRR